MKFKREKALLFILIILLGVFFGFVKASNEMVIKINLVDYKEEYEIYLSVPEEINLGNITKNNPKTLSEMKKINNTGTKSLIVTTSLKEPYDSVFDYLYLKKYGDSNEYKINEFNLTVPSKSNRSFYVGINLTNFNKTYDVNNINLNTTLIFNAIPE
ncbi:hypothetical protein GYA25_00530 [Candidatus Woesearchaeota archaeon]|jgi:hypothetical protein|nr:hypothetical protein [Candidatus Woesearchaeota archaeon]